MTWSLSAGGPSKETRQRISEQAQAATLNSNGAHKVVVNRTADLIEAILDQYPEGTASVSGYGHADEKGMSSYKLEITISPQSAAG